MRYSGVDPSVESLHPDRLARRQEVTVGVQATPPSDEAAGALPWLCFLTCFPSAPKRTEGRKKTEYAARMGTQRARVRSPSHRTIAAVSPGDWPEDVLRVRVTKLRRAGVAIAHGGQEFFRLNWLRDVAVHAGRQAALPIALHGMRRHRDDRNVCAADFFLLANDG